MMEQKTIELLVKPNGQSIVLLEGQDISHVVNGISFALNVHDLPVIQLGIFAHNSVYIPPALMDVTVVDFADAVRLRDMLAEAIIALETVMEAHDDAPTPQLREQIDRWKRHQEFPEGEKLGRYIERMRTYDAQRPA